MEKKAKYFSKQKYLLFLYTRSKPENKLNTLNLIMALNTIELVFLDSFESKVVIISL